MSYVPKMKEDSLYETDSRAIKELKDLYAFFCEASDCHLSNASTGTGGRCAAGGGAWRRNYHAGGPSNAWRYDFQH